MRSDASHHPDDDDRLCIPTIDISKVALGTVGDAGDA